MDKLSYLESKKLVNESFDEFLNDEGFTVEQAIAATLEDSVLMMKQNGIVYISVISSLAILALKENVIPDYILERLENLETDIFSKEEKKIFLLDEADLNSRLRKQDFSVLKDDIYKARVDMLLK